MHYESKASKFIVFKVADYLLALPISNVLKVVKFPPTTNKGLKTMGLVQLGHHTIRVLDLHLPQLPDSQPFLVIMCDSQGELCGISVDAPPDLVELPLERIRLLPKSDRQFSALEMVTHAAVLSQEEATKTIFMLDIKRVMNTTLDNLSQRSLRPS